LNLILFGPPGAGKGTQCEHISEKYGLYKLSTGDMIRQEIKDQTAIGRQVQAIVESGKFPDSDLVNKMVESTVKRLKGSKGIVFDGYPRTLDQGEFLDGLFGELHAKIDCIIMLDVDEDHLVPRILSRFTCATCGAIYSDARMPLKEGICDKCGDSEFVHRADDTEDIIRTRFDTYRRETEEIIQYYDQQGRVIHIDGNQSIETVTEAIDRIIDNKQAELMREVC
jgi:adenylate kinase